MRTIWLHLLLHGRANCIGGACGETQFAFAFVSCVLLYEETVVEKAFRSSLSSCGMAAIWRHGARMSFPPRSYDKSKWTGVIRPLHRKPIPRLGR